jgi:hypothetical protein
MEKILLIVFFLLLCYTTNSGMSISNKETMIRMYDECELNYENLLSVMIFHQLKFPEIILRQIRLETGNLKIIRNNNLLCFKKKRYMKFDTWQDCIKYLKVWQLRNYKGGDYYRFLHKIRYAKDKNYVNKLKRFSLN